VTLEQLEQQRAARLAPEQLRNMPMNEAADYVAATATLDNRVSAAKQAVATIAELTAQAEADANWLANLGAWRAVLCDELLAIPMYTREKTIAGKRLSLNMSIDAVDRGITDTYRLVVLRLGQLMQASGYQPLGADPAQNNHGRMPWFGCVKEVEQRIKVTEERLLKAQAQLDDLLLDDDLRAEREARTKKLRAVGNSMRVRPDGRSGLRVVDGDNQPVDESTLTEDQRESLAWMRAAWATS
jgi:hypothetical protein